MFDLVTRTGIDAEERRIGELVTFLERRRGPAGIWIHPNHPELSRWLTFDLLSGMRRLTTGGWIDKTPKLRRDSGADGRTKVH